MIPSADAGTASAIRSALETADVPLGFRPRNGTSAWWKRGLAEAVERVPAAPRIPDGQEVALPPRSTRGAMRA